MLIKLKNSSITLILALMLIIISGTNSSSAQLVPNFDAGLVERDVRRFNEQDITQKAEEKIEQKRNIPEDLVETQDLPDTEVKGDDLKILINDIQFSPSTLLSAEELETIAKEYEGKELTLTEMQKLATIITGIYREKGFLSAKAIVPPQNITDGVLKIQLIEAEIEEIKVNGNRWTRSSFVKGKIDQKEGEILNLKTLEKNILQFNRKYDVGLKATLEPGTEFGKTIVNLNLTEQNPYHIFATFDNTGRETVGILRGGIGVSTDSLLGYRDQFSVGYAGADGTNVAYSQYAFPLGNHGTEIIGNFSFSSIKVKEGPFKDLNIEGNSYIYGLKVLQPFVETKKVTFSGDIGLNFKQSTTFISEDPLFTTQVRSLVAGLNLQVVDKYGIWILRQEFDNGLDLFGGNATYFKANSNLLRYHQFGHGILGILKGNLQLTDDTLPSIENYQIGGSSSVRGYSEGLLTGDNGYLISGELRFPLPFLPRLIGNLEIRDRVKGVVFVDHGGAFADDSTKTVKDTLTSVGMGLRVRLTKYIIARTDWGFGLGQRETPQPTARFHFGIQSNLL